MWRVSLLFISTLALADTRNDLAKQLTDESAAIDTALATVAEKLTLVDADRTKRLGAAYRTLNASSKDPMVAARSRAAARMLVARDLEERQLLSGELSELRTAKQRVTTEVARVPQIELPEDLARPAKGTIARRFGVFVHDRSKAQLSRRGVDIEVEGPRTPVVAMADGTVRYAGPIRGLDKGIVIDHGSYFTVVAKLGDLAVPIGVPVKRGDAIGRTARHRAYVEVRVKIGPSGLPIDPEPLFAR